MTPEQLAEIRARWQSATYGPWPHTISTATMRASMDDIPSLLDARNAADDHVRVLRAALADLVYLKDEIHDTPEYHERKETAWQEIGRAHV